MQFWERAGVTRWDWLCLRYAPTRQVPCRMKAIGDVYNAQVKQVSWHPLCCQCLVVLNGDGNLRFYDVLAGDGSGGVAHPTFALAVGSDETNPMRGLDTDHGAVAFDFGPAVGWETFAIFVLLENSDITYFCPVVPPGSVVCTSVLDDLVDASTPGTSSYLTLYIGGARHRSVAAWPLHSFYAAARS